MFAHAFVVRAQVEYDFRSFERQFRARRDGCPHVFADFHSEAAGRCAEDEVPAQRHLLTANQHGVVAMYVAGSEPALFVEFLVIGQVGLGDNPEDFSFLYDSGTIQ